MSTGKHRGSHAGSAPRKRDTDSALRALPGGAAFWRSFFENSPDVVTVVGRDRRIAYINRVAPPRSFAQVLGSDVFEYIPPARHAELQARLDRVFESGAAQRWQMPAVGPGGRPAVYETRAVPIIRGGHVVAAILIPVDVTERVRAAETQTALYRISEAAHTAASLQELFGAIHRIIGELMPARNFYIALHDAPTGMVSFPYFVDEYDTTPAPKLPGKGLTEYVLRTGEPLLATPEVVAELERRGEVELIGAPSIDWLGVPLTTQGRTIGVLVVQTYTEGVRYTETHKDVLQFVSTQAAMAIERKRAEEAVRESAAALRESEEKFRSFIETTTDWVWSIDLASVHTYSNPAVEGILGYAPDELIGKSAFLFMHPDDQAEVERQLACHAAERSGWKNLVVRWRRKDGGYRFLESSAAPILGAGGRLEGWRGVDRDITARKLLEDQLRQAQKMEAVGQLAGGVAHDFNNLLTAVLASNDLVASQLPPESPCREDVETIRAAARRGADLTSKLLAFSRQQALELRSVCLGTLLSDFTRIARRVVPEDVEVVLHLDEPDAVVRADPVAVEQILMNLVTNARDAMPAGGTLRLQVERTTVDEAKCAERGWGTPGEYVMLSVSDTGTGMDLETQRRLFEPFYTTKPVGQGTGLGMAMVYGLVKQHDGYVTVYSEPAQGTTVRIYLPAERAEAAPADQGAEQEVPGGKETILLVEDDATLQRAASRALERFGYTVLKADNGYDALAIMKALEKPPDLIISDVVMPQTSGPQLLSALRDAGAAPKMLFTSGYTARAARERTQLDPGVPFLPKPWSMPELLRKVREVLDTSGTN